jgi:hypothetical protein
MPLLLSSLWQLLGLECHSGSFTGQGRMVPGSLLGQWAFVDAPSDARHWRVHAVCCLTAVFTTWQTCSARMRGPDTIQVVNVVLHHLVQNFVACQLHMVMWLLRLLSQ